MKDTIHNLTSEEITTQCTLCTESRLPIGTKTAYGSVIIYRNGTSANGWFATLSPKTGGNPEQDFTIQLMSNKHLTHFCQINTVTGCAENYGSAFAKLTRAITEFMASENKSFKVTADSRDTSESIATYGKCTNWKEKKEHLHIKIFPFRGATGQPYTVDSTFEKKTVHKDTDGEYVKMMPVRKVNISTERFNYLTQKMMALLK